MAIIISFRGVILLSFFLLNTKEIGVVIHSPPAKVKHTHWCSQEVAVHGIV